MKEASRMTVSDGGAQESEGFEGGSSYGRRCGVRHQGRVCQCREFCSFRSLRGSKKALLGRVTKME